MPRQDPRAISIQAQLDYWARNALPHVPAANRGTLVRGWYAQQGFLARAARALSADQLIVAGATSLRLTLLAQQYGGRVTQDLDIDLPQISDEGHLRALLEAIITAPLPADQDDHLVFEPTFSLKHVLPGTAAGGYRAVIHARLGASTRILFTLDIALQVEVVPTPEMIEVERLLQPAAPIPVHVAPVEAVLAGKVASLLRNGFQTTRLKDFYDCWLASERRDFEGDRMIAAVQAICRQQGVAIDPQAEVFSANVLPQDGAQLERWETFLKVRWLEAPAFPVVVQALRALYVPVLDGTAAGRIWQHQHQLWSALS
jgi:hypothetical protein